jgi:hypothetical protein
MTETIQMATTVLPELQTPVQEFRQTPRAPREDATRGQPVTQVIILQVLPAAPIIIIPVQLTIRLLPPAPPAEQGPQAAQEAPTALITPAPLLQMGAQGQQQAAVHLRLVQEQPDLQEAPAQQE